MAHNKNWLLSLKQAAGETKQQGLISELIRLIQSGMKEGESLPSVNSVSRELNISRDTVFKAYSELKKRGIVRSTPTKGYYVSHQISKILLLLDYYSPFKDIVYQEIKSSLDDTYSIDLVFHHYNRSLFDTVVLDSIGRYDTYIIMNFDAQEMTFSESLSKIEPSRLLLLDIPILDWKEADPRHYSYVCQDFDKSVTAALKGISSKIERYSDFVFINPDDLKHPLITLKAFSQYCTKSGIRLHVGNDPRDMDLMSGHAFFVLRQRDLTILLEMCRQKGLVPGKDIGILAYNDIPLYEFVANGITVVSTDFHAMGKKAAQFVLKKDQVREVIPTKIIIRNSL